MAALLSLALILPTLISSQSLPDPLVEPFSTLAVGFDDVLSPTVIVKVKTEVETYQAAGDIYER